MTPNEREVPEALKECARRILRWKEQHNDDPCAVLGLAMKMLAEVIAPAIQAGSPSREAILAEGRRLGLLEALRTHDQQHQYGECACVRCEDIRGLIRKPGVPEGGADYEWRADPDAGTLTCRPVPANSPAAPRQTGCGICGGPCDASCNCGCHLAAPPTGVPEGGAPDDGMARLLRCEQEDETGRCSRVASIHSHGLNVCSECYDVHRGDGRLPCPRCPELPAPPPAVPVGDLANDMPDAICKHGHDVPEWCPKCIRGDATKKEQPAFPAVPQEGTQGRGEAYRFISDVGAGAERTATVRWLREWSRKAAEQWGHAKIAGDTLTAEVFEGQSKALSQAADRIERGDHTSTHQGGR